MILGARILAIGFALAAGAAFAVTDAQAERLIVSVSNHRVTVTPNYSGEELVLFGSVEKDDKTPANRNNYDLVVTVSGPRADMVTRRKERKFGIWVNNDYRQFLKVPTYLAIFSNRPFEAIAPPEVQRRQQLGLNNVLLMQRVGPDYADVVPDDAFRSAFVRLRARAWPLSRGHFRGDVPDADAVSHRHSASWPKCRSGPTTSTSSCLPMARW